MTFIKYLLKCERQFAKFELVSPCKYKKNSSLLKIYGIKIIIRTKNNWIIGKKQNKQTKKTSCSNEKVKIGIIISSENRCVSLWFKLNHFSYKFWFSQSHKNSIKFHLTTHSLNIIEKYIYLIRILIFCQSPL